MIRLLALGVPNFPGMLSNGRSPVCWQRQLAQQVAQPKRLERACHWLDELAQQHVPSLQSGPLLGACLSELVKNAPPVATPEEIARPRAARPAPPASSQAKSVAQKVLLPSGSSKSNKPTTWPQSRRAHHDLLQKWAGTTAVLPKTVTRTRNHPFQPKGVNQRPPLPAASQPALPHPNQVHALSEQLARRTRQRLALPETAVSQQASATFHPRFSRPASHATQPPAKKPETLLETQWRQLIAGQIAPHSLLERLHASATTPESTAARQPDGPDQQAPEPRSKHSAQPVAPNSAQQARQTSPASRESLTQGLPHTPTPALPSKRDPVRLPASLTSQRETAAAEAPPHLDESDNGWQIAPRFAPPQMAKRLPRLRPLPPPGTLASQPTAAATARESARREATNAAAEAPEALHTLARQIKQILDEESRRHGIEV